MGSNRHLASEFIVTRQPPPWFSLSADSLIGERNYLYRQTCFAGTSKAIISSRLKHPLYHQRSWFAALNQSLNRAQANRQLILTTPHTTTDEFIKARQVVCRFKLGHITCCIEPSQWENALANPKRYLCTPFDTVVGPTQKGNTAYLPVRNAGAFRDQMLIACSPWIDILQIHKQGTLAKLLPFKSASQIRYVSLPHITPEPTLPNITHPQPWPVLPDWIHNQRYVAHWTRGCDGAWPGETREQWINQLIDNDPQADHSALRTLHRIIQSECLYSSDQTIRGGFPMTCFTRVPINQWSSRHVYRSHLRRWDFCPYGLAIKRDWIQGQGLAPVRYGSDNQWELLAANERPYFQTTGGSINWRVEQEERIAGNLDLRSSQSTDIVFFTSLAKEAVWLQAASRWPVVPVDQFS